MPTAYLSPSQLQDLTNVSSTAPGSGDNGKALVWNQAAGKWQAEQVAYSNLSGAPALPIPVVSGGTGTQTGSITGPGALTFTPGGTTNPINLTVSKSTKVQVGTSSTEGAVLYVGPVNVGYNPADISGFNYGAIGVKGILGGIFYMQDSSNNGGQFFYDSNGLSFSNITGTIASKVGFNSGDARQPFEADAIRITTSNNVEFGRGSVSVLNNTASTSTTTGALTVTGGAGIAGALHVGGQINGLGAVQPGTPASAAATGTAGQIRWDADYIYVCTATNTWKRVAISTW